MNTGTNRTGFRPAGAWARALCAICSLVIAVGGSFATDPGNVRKDVLDQGPSLRLATIQPDSSQASPNPDAPDLGCAAIALPNDGGTSGNERAPNLRNRFGRSVYLILASELAANGIASGTGLSGIGWTFSTAPGVSGSNNMIVYMQNTADTTNTKSTDWATAITGMTTVHNGAVSVPNVTGGWTFNFAGGSPFTYTGGGLYVAFDAAYPVGTLSAVTVVSCNAAGLVNGLLGAQGAAAPTTLAASNFRPETRLIPTVGFANDISVDVVYQYGSLSLPLIGAQTIKAIVTNRGTSPQNAVNVSLNVTGANTFSNNQATGILTACGGTQTMTFAAYTPTNLGSDTVTVSVPADGFNGNNSVAHPLDETLPLYSYKYPGTTAGGGVGVNGATADFVGKFTTTVARNVTAVNLEFPLASGQAYRVAIYPDSGSGTPGTVPIYQDAADRTVGAIGPVTATLPSPVSVGPGNFFVGVQQTGTVNIGLGFDVEAPIRAGSFYFASPHPAATWTDLSPGNNFKMNIGVVFDVQCNAAAQCNDSNACTDDACTNLTCTHSNNNSVTECDANSCSSPDICNNGVCTPGPNPCNDNNACTIDLCDGQGGCIYNPVNCDDANACTTDSCNPATGCAHANNTGPCSDGNPCTLGDVCSGGACVPGSAPSAVQFCNNGTISIPTSGIATPYPAAISVSGAQSYLCSVTVDLNSLTHTYPADVEVLLTHLAGSNSIVMAAVGGSSSITGVNLTLSDAASSSMPGTGPLVSGTYKPTNLGAIAWPAPAPAPSGGSALSAFTGTNPNGTWNLWVYDTAPPDGGSFSGYCLNIAAVCTLDADCNDGNPCTNDACVNAACTHTNNSNPCDDNNACTANDACTNGVCTGGPPPPCDDGNACTANNCNPQTAQCENPPIVCNDNNACTDDSCNTQTGCVFAANDNNACSDNTLCTPTDLCINGVCVGQNPVVCNPDANLCTTEACDPATGLCASTNNTNPCDDANPCTIGDVCGPNTTPTPVEDFDAVTAPALPAGWSSSTTGSGAAWVTSALSADTPPNSAFGFDGAGPLAADEVLESPTIAIISPTAKLSFQNTWTFEGTTPNCYDAGVLEIKIGAGAYTDIVTAGGSFISGGYTGTVSSGFSNPLGGRSAWCFGSAGSPAYLTSLVNLPAAAAGQTIQLRWRVGTDTSVGAAGQNIDSIVIFDGPNVCNPGTGAPNCDDGNLCTDDYCDPGSGCQHAANQEVCDDNDLCTVADQCTNGTCTGTVVVCNDFNACTLDVCNPQSGCTFTDNSAACNDNNACTNDSCNPGTGCVYANNTNACDDGNPCTAGDVCGAGSCIPGAPVPPPGEAQNVSVAADKSTYSWSATAGATGYDVVRGSIGALPVGPGSGDEVPFCGLGSNVLVDPFVPAPSGSLFYIARAKNACGSGTYGTQSNGSPRVTTTCP